METNLEYNLKMETIDLESIQKENYSENGNNPCIICGKDIKDSPYFVHLLNDGNLINIDDEGIENSMGLQPIGKTCKKKLPEDFIF